MNSNERRLKVLYTLQSGKRVTTKSLMDQFGISKRTVYRDLRIIQDLGVPITHYQDSGYGVLRDGLIPPIMFTFRELAVIMMGLSFVKSQIDSDLVGDAETVTVKISNAIPASLQKQMNILDDKTLVSPYIHNIKKREKGGDWFTLCSAFVENKAVTFIYKDKKGKKTKRSIDPYLLIHYTDHWNVIGYCHERKALRNFILSRMSEISLREKLFTDDKPYSIDELLYGRSGDDMQTVEVDIHKTKAFTFLSELPGKIQANTKAGNHLRIRFSIDNLPLINEWLLRFGDNVIVRSPEELITMRRKLLESLLLSTNNKPGL